MTRSFAQLEKDKDVTAEEFQKVLQHYVISGAAIKSSVIIALIERTTLTPEDRVALSNKARNGHLTQKQRNCPAMADEYKKVVNHLTQ